MDKQNVVQDSLFNVMAEIVLEQSLQAYQKKVLYEQIDQSLADRDKQRFLQLTEKLNELLKLEIK